MSRGREETRKGRARSIANGGARDLSALKMSEEEAREAQEVVEHKLGARCNGCGRRITMGFKFTSLDVRDSKGRVVVTMSACTREDCDFAERCKDGATFMEMVEFAWVDENGADAPASLSVTRRNEQMARQAARESEPPGG